MSRLYPERPFLAASVAVFREGRVLLGRRSRRGLGDVAKDFGYKGNWNYRLNSTEKTALRFKRAQLEDCLHILQRLDTDLKSSKLDADLLMQKALCELALAGRA